MLSLSDITRFESKFYVTPGCWIWTGSKNTGGHGQFTVCGKCITAHRVSYELYIGPIPEGMWVLHKCDNPPCQNPDHLFLGTRQDNVDDMVRKGRQSRYSKLNGEYIQSDLPSWELFRCRYLK